MNKKILRFLVLSFCFFSIFSEKTLPCTFFDNKDGESAGFTLIDVNGKEPDYEMFTFSELEKSPPKLNQIDEIANSENSEYFLYIPLDENGDSILHYMAKNKSFIKNESEEKDQISIKNIKGAFSKLEKINILQKTTALILVNNLGNTSLHEAAKNNNADFISQTIIWWFEELEKSAISLSNIFNRVKNKEDKTINDLLSDETKGEILNNLKDEFDYNTVADISILLQGEEQEKERGRAGSFGRFKSLMKRRKS